MKQFIEERVARIKSDAEQYVQSRNMELSNHLSDITIVGECEHERLRTRAWVAGIMKIAINRAQSLEGFHSPKLHAKLRQTT
ncbi:MAG: hypothetical protein F4Z14_08525 [Gammaproteobacteria bacterium]|nr:hypothetical protein [Gammaproteobacteria bacterium]